MKNLSILFVFIFLFSVANAWTYELLTKTWKYDSNSILYKSSNTTWEKKLSTWDIFYKWATISWSKYKNWKTSYETPNTSFYSKGDYIKYTRPNTSYEKKDWTIIYKTPNTTLTISKDRIEYVTPNTKREINGWDWKYSDPRNSYSN